MEKFVNRLMVYFFLVFATVLLEVSEGYNEEALYNDRPYKRWSPVKEYHYGEPVEIKRSLPSKRWSPVKEYHYDGPIEIKRGISRQFKRWSPVKEFHYGEPIEI
ncbi:unnamed protein product [Trichobilharzia szidati]|nr:unnamed protein product [Trichobilharzia szidati]